MLATHQHGGGLLVVTDPHLQTTQQKSSITKLQICDLKKLYDKAILSSSSENEVPTQLSEGTCELSICMTVSVDIAVAGNFVNFESVSFGKKPI